MLMGESQKGLIDVGNMGSETETVILSQEVLLKEVKMLEARGLEKNKIALAYASNLDQLLNEVYISRLPKQIDYDNRRDLVRIFNAIVKEIFGNCNDSPIVEGFGSFVMGIFSPDSDLDLSINFRDNAGKIPRLKKIQTLRNLAKRFYLFQRGGHVSGIQTIMTARVPIVKVIDRGTRIECDVSVDNRDGIEKSLIIRAISTIDERFRKLCFLIKAWAKAHDINSSKDRTLNSLSLVSLVAFHLQTRDPPIFPPFSALFKDGNDPTAVMKMIKNYLNYGIRNKESVAELFVTLLIKLASVENLWQKGVCVSLCRGSWISKALGFRCTINVEDFTDQYENVSRAVGREGFEKIYGCIRRSLHYLEAFSNGQMQISKLKELLFDRDTIGDRVAMDLFKTTAEINSNEIKTMKLTEKQSKTQLVHNESSQTKKRVFAEDLDKSKGKKQCKGVTLLEGKGGVQFKEVGRKQPVENEVKPLLISRDTIGSNIATHLVKTTTNSSVSNKSDEKNKTKLTEHLGPENQSNGQLVHHGSSQTKKRPFTEDLDKSKGKKQCKGANYVEGKGGVQFKEGGNKQPVENEVKPLPISRDTIGDSVATNHVKITTKVSVPNNSNEIKTELTENLGMVHQTKTQLGHHESSQTEKRPFKDDLGKSKGKKHCKGAKPLERKGGVQIKEGGKKQPVENEVKPLPTSGWQGKHPVDGRREWKTFGENSGHLTTHFAPQVPHLAPHSHSSDSLSCYDPVMFPSISASSFTHLQGFCNPIQQHPLFPLLNSLGLNASYILTPPAPMPHIGPIHGQHAQNQTHTVPRRPWE